MVRNVVAAEISSARVFFYLEVLCVNISIDVSCCSLFPAYVLLGLVKLVQLRMKNQIKIVNNVNKRNQIKKQFVEFVDNPQLFQQRKRNTMNRKFSVDLRFWRLWFDISVLLFFFFFVSVTLQILLKVQSAV